MIAFSLDNLLFFLLIAVAALFQLLSKTISKAKKSDSNETSSSPTPQTPRPIQRAPRESDADRIRKFLEALGQPPSSTPPSPVLPRTNIPPRPLAPVQPPPALPACVAITSRTAQRNRTSAKEKVFPLNSRAGCSKSFHHPYRLRLRQRSKFKRRSRLSLSSRRLSKRLWNLTRQVRQLPNAQGPKEISPRCSHRNRVCARQSSFAKF